jgi:hypothetical protein
MKTVGTGKSQSSMTGGNKKCGPIRTTFVDRVMTGGGKK